MEATIAGTIITKDGEATQKVVRDAPVVAYYFSAHWCPPCRKFTPILADLYDKWNADGKKIEIVWISFDKKENEYNEYYSTMPWACLPFNDGRIPGLSEKFEVKGIPSLCIVSKDEKETCLSNNGFEDVMLKREKAIDIWLKLYN